VISFFRLQCLRWKLTHTNAKYRHSISLWTRKSAANCSFLLAQMKEVISSTTIFEEQLRKQAPLGSQRSWIKKLMCCLSKLFFLCVERV
jgi:hypothetical protein